MRELEEPKRKLPMDERRMLVLSFLLSGNANRTKIAARLSEQYEPVSADTIGRDIDWLNNLYRERAGQEMALAKGQDFVRIERMIEAAWPKAMDRGHKGQTAAIRVIKELLERKAKMLGYDEPDQSVQTISATVSPGASFGERMSRKEADALYESMLKALPAGE